MAVFSEVIAMMIILVTEPFTLYFQSCMFVLRTMFVVMHTWLELLKASISFHLNLLWKMMTWSLAFITLPGRVLKALQRERQLRLIVEDMRIELERLVLDREELRKHIRGTIKEHKMMELILTELAEECDKAGTKIKLLEKELQDLRNENSLLKEAQIKSYWSRNSTHQDEIPSRKSSYGERNIIFQDILMQKDTIMSQITSKTKSINGTILPVGSEALDEKRRIALSQSFFSATLSLLVGVIIWESETPCLPLVVALLTVVAISLKSVVQFFSTLRNKPASEAVTLLCFNWFLLGLLTSPILPWIVHASAPLGCRFVNQVAIWLGPSSSNRA